MIIVTIECDRCGKRIEKKHSWVRDLSLDALREFYAAQGFSDAYLDMDVCPVCKDKFEDITFRE